MISTLIFLGFLIAAVLVAIKTKDKMFVGENWTHLNLDRLVETLGNRVRDIKHTPYHQMLIFLKEK